MKYLADTVEKSLGLRKTFYVDHEKEVEMMSFARQLRQTNVEQLKRFTDLPELLNEQIEVAAKDLLQWRLRLRFTLKVLKARRQMHSSKNKEHLTVPLLRGSPLFKYWPEGSLSLLIGKAVPCAYDRHEFIFHDKESSASGLVIVLRGEVQKRKNPTYERVPAPVILGDLIQISREDHSYAVTTLQPSYGWALKHVDIMSELANLDPESRSRVESAVADTVSGTMPVELPLSAVELKAASKIFKPVAVGDLREILTKVTPCVVHRGKMIYKQNELSSCCYVLRKGVARVVDEDGSSRQVYTPISTIGDLEMLFREGRRVGVVAVTQCYLYKIMFGDLKAKPAVLKMVSRAAADCRRDIMDNTAVHRSVSQCILFAQLPPAVQQEISQLFKPVVVAPTELIASSSEVITHIHLITRGCVTVGGLDTYRYPREDQITPGEMIGYTGLYPQRWSYPLYAAVLTECWTLSCADLVGYLRSKGIFNALYAKSKELYILQARGTVRYDYRGVWRKARLSVKSVVIAKRVVSRPETPPADQHPELHAGHPIVTGAARSAAALIKGTKKLIPEKTLEAYYRPACTWKRPVAPPDVLPIELPRPQRRRLKTAAPGDVLKTVPDSMWEAFDEWEAWKRAVYVKDPTDVD